MPRLTCATGWASASPPLPRPPRRGHVVRIVVGLDRRPVAAQVGEGVHSILQDRDCTLGLGQVEQLAALGLQQGQPRGACGCVSMCGWERRREEQVQQVGAWRGAGWGTDCRCTAGPSRWVDTVAHDRRGHLRPTRALSGLTLLYALPPAAPPPPREEESLLPDAPPGTHGCSAHARRRRPGAWTPPSWSTSRAAPSAATVVTRSKFMPVGRGRFSACGLGWKRDRCLGAVGGVRHRPRVAMGRGPVISHHAAVAKAPVGRWME